MNESLVLGSFAGVLQFMVAGYALRLNRRFGTSRVGWSLFCAFSLLALLHLLQSATSFDANLNSALVVNVIYALISFLLLLGLIHLETMLKERSRRERAELQMRTELESEVKSKTAHLTRAIEELMREMEETKRMAAILESAEKTTLGQAVEGLTDGVPESVLEYAAARCDSEEEPFLAGVLGGDWVARF